MAGVSRGEKPPLCKRGAERSEVGGVGNPSVSLAADSSPCTGEPLVPQRKNRKDAPRNAARPGWVCSAALLFEDLFAKQDHKHDDKQDRAERKGQQALAHALRGHAYQQEHGEAKENGPGLMVDQVV